MGLEQSLSTVPKAPSLKKLRKDFLEYCSYLKIETKDYGIQRFKLNGCQRFLVNEIWKGFEEGVRTFIILKGRQQGISTICDALDTFWWQYFPAVQGAVIVDEDGNRQYFRSVITRMIESLPEELDWGIVVHNRDMLLLENGSRISYMVAGTKKKTGSLGKSKAINYLHGTECGTWGDQQGLNSLMNTLSDKYPNRLYLFESTAYGFNVFHEMWETAKRAVSQKAIFVPWWLKEEYAVEEEDKRFDTYYDLKLNDSERIWIRDVKREYDYEININQLVWWRWKLSEEMRGVESDMMQDHPPTADYAFIMSGSKFFQVGALTDQYKVATDKEYLRRRYSYGQYWYDMECYETNEERAELKIWERPTSDGIYVIGADPSIGAGRNPDAFCLEVCRCYMNRCEQVAEFRATNLNTDEFAWVICHLAGVYEGARGTCFIIIESNGSGLAVQKELQNVKSNKSIISYDYIHRALKFEDVLPNMAFYLYSNPRSIFTSSRELNLSMTRHNKSHILNKFRSAVEKNVFVVNSLDAIQEMRYIHSTATESGNQIIKGEGSNKDDRVIAMALACHMWEQYVMDTLRNDKVTYEGSIRGMINEDNPYDQNIAEKSQNVIQNIVENHLRKWDIDPQTFIPRRN